MSLLKSIRLKLFGANIPEKEAIVAQIEHETKRLNGAVKNLTLETGVVRKHRIEMNRMLDDALQTIGKEHRK